MQRRTRSTSTESATTAAPGARHIASLTPSATLPQTQPACLTDDTTGLVDCGNWSESASWAVPGTAVSGVYIAKLARSRHQRREPDPVRRAQRRQPFGPAVPDLGHDVAGVQRLRRQQPVHGRTGNESRPGVQGELQPAVHDAGPDARGRVLQRRVPDGPVAGGERLRRVVHRRRRRRRRAGEPVGAAPRVHVGRPRRVLVGEPARQRRSGARRGREPRVLQRQPDLLEDPLGAEHRRHVDGAPHTRVVQGDPRRGQDRSRSGVDGHLARPARRRVRRGTAGERARRNDLHGELLHHRDQRAGERPTAAAVAQLSPVVARGRRRHALRRNARATSGTRISTTGRAHRARSTCRRRRRRSPRSSRTKGRRTRPGPRRTRSRCTARRAARSSSTRGRCSGRGDSTARTTAAARRRTRPCSRQR